MLITTAGQSKMNTCLSVYLCSYPNSHESCHKVLGYGSWNNADTGRTIQLMFISVGEIQWSHWAPKNLLNSWQPHTQQTPEFTQSGTKKGRKKLFFFFKYKNHYTAGGQLHRNKHSMNYCGCRGTLPGWPS